MKPHFEAVLTTRTTLPLRWERGQGLPFSVEGGEKRGLASWCVYVWRMGGRRGGREFGEDEE